MKKPRKLHEAIALVFSKTESGMLPSEILAIIEEQSLYPFLTDDRIGVVRRELRRHCEGIDFKSASDTKRYRQDSAGRYYPFNESVIKSIKRNQSRGNRLKDEILKLREQHILDLRKSILKTIKEFEPYDFESFSRRLLQAYGFFDVKVTRRSRDGGIDGHGRISFGMTEIAAAFQCKRYTKKNVSISELQSFRGSISGRFQQGIFFSTSSFTKDAQSASVQPGAVPIALIDGPQIAAIMIDRRIGVEKESVELYTYMPDSIIDDSE